VVCCLGTCRGFVADQAFRKAKRSMLVDSNTLNLESTASESIAAKELHMVDTRESATVHSSVLPNPIHMPS
jgi:hypothetical protein